MRGLFLKISFPVLLLGVFRLAALCIQVQYLPLLCPALLAVQVRGGFWGSFVVFFSSCALVWYYSPY